MLPIGLLLLALLVFGLRLLTRPRSRSVWVLIGCALGGVGLALALQHSQHETLLGIPVWTCLTSGIDWLIDLALPFLDVSDTDRRFLRADSLLPLVLNVALVLAAGTVWHFVSKRSALQQMEVPALLRRTVMRDLFALLLVLVVLGFGVAPQLAPLLGDWLNPLREVTKQVFWSALAIPLALLWGATRDPVPPMRLAAAEPSPPSAVPDGDLAGFLAMLRQDYAACLLADPRATLLPEAEAEAPGGMPSCPVSPASRAVHRIIDTLGRPGRGRLPLSASQCDAVAEKLGPFLPVAPDDRPPNPLFEEDLAAIHFVLLAELVLSVQDRGGVALVIAPAGALRRVDDALRDAIADHGGGFSPRSLRLDDQIFDTAQRYSLLLGSEDAVDGILLQGEQHQAREYCITHLGLIVVLDFHRLDAALLRLRISEIADRLGRRPVQAMVQSEPRIGVAGAVETCFFPLSTGGFEPLRLASTAGSRRHVVLWRHDHAALKQLVDRELRTPPGDWRLLDSAATLAFAARRFRVSVAGLDGDERDGPGWDALQRVLGEDAEAQRRVAELRRIEQAMESFPGSDSQILLVRDRGNLAEALARTGNFAGQREHALLVLSHDYALRDFLVERLRSGERPDQLLPIASAADGGSTECATVLAGEFARNPTQVPQQRVERLFDLIAPDLRAAFGLDPTPAGVDRLFQREADRSVGAVRKDTDQHEVILSLRDATAPPPPPRLMLPARPVGREREPAQMRLSRGDYGLAYADDTKLDHNGRRWTVSGVTADGVLLTADRATTQPALRYLFHRQYRPRFKWGSLAMLAEPKASWRGQVLLQRVLLRGEVERQTCMIGSHLKLHRPTSPSSRLEWHAPARRSYSVARTGDATVLLIRYGFPSLETLPMLSGDSLPRLAFTLAATLQDVLASLFPEIGHRFAVLSPQAGPAIATALTKPRGDPERHPVERFPRLLDGDTAYDPSAAPADPTTTEAAIGSLLEYLRLHVLGARDFANAELNATTRHLDFVIVEDSDHDLGALRAVQGDGWTQLIPLWRDFAAWGAQQKSEAGFHYRYGGAALPGIFDFDAAAALLAAVARPEDGAGDA